MPLFGSLMSGFDDDPFFGHRNMMRQMDEMMSAMTADPFMSPTRGFPPMMGMAPFQQALVPAGHPQNSVQHLHSVDPFSAFGMPGMNMLASMDQMSRGGNCHSFSSSSVMTMTTGPDGKPQVYQASSSTRAAPDGVKETRRTESDSTTGMRKMAIGHHIKDRSHVIEKEHTRDGDVEERQEFINLDEEEAPRFDAEFRRHIQQAPQSLEYRSRYRPTGRGSHRSVPALPSSSNHEDRQRRRDREERGVRGDHRYNPAI